MTLTFQVKKKCFYVAPVAVAVPHNIAAAVAVHNIAAVVAVHNIAAAVAVHNIAVAAAVAVAVATAVAVVAATVATAVAAAVAVVAATVAPAVVAATVFDTATAAAAAPGHFPCPNLGIANSRGHTWSEQRRFALSTLRDFGLGKVDMEQLVREEVEELMDVIERVSEIV